MMDFTVISNEKIARDVFKMQLSAVSLSTVPGQFVNLQIDGHYLRRPISVCDWDPIPLRGGVAAGRGGLLTLIYKVVGQGTARLARYEAGETINALTGLGNGYTLVPAERPLLLGGGVGVPPLYYLAKELVKLGQKPIAVLGFNTTEDLFYKEEFTKICETIVVTDGFVTDALPELDYDALYTCGPEPMLRAVYNQAKELPPGHAQFSFERRMGCGFGACMVCSCKTVTGYKRICKEGPILAKEEILWK